MGQNRRRSERIPVGFYVEQIVDDDPHRCFTTDLSSFGIYVERVADPLQRSTNVVQLEIPLPETGDTLWAKGEVIYDRFDAIFHGSAIRFAGMARAHQRLLRDWLWEARREAWLPRPELRVPRSPRWSREPGATDLVAAARGIRVRRPAPRTRMQAALAEVPSLPGTLPERGVLPRPHLLAGS